ncbi:hypothetical protein GCM10010517_72970 [Streptosporangium fragile]|uniref:Integrase n=1 Tax=Streptosporangium fragile TaxID=46186 RepID=A0ABP6IRN2_9ACTN
MAPLCGADTEDRHLRSALPDPRPRQGPARPCGLRHAAVSLWLNAGVPATEVAKRAGHSVDVLLRVYAKCMEGQQHLANGKIDKVLDE